MKAHFHTLFTLLLISLLLSTVVVNASISQSTIRLKYSETEPGNLLPSFLFMQGSEEGGTSKIPLGGGRGTPQPFRPSDDCSDSLWEGVMEDLRSPQLPYLRQDLWGCQRLPTDIPVLKLDTVDLTAFITPQWGGKIWSLFDKKANRDVLFNNPAHQPANIGALGSWTSGGWEFNWSPGIIGHSAFTESPVWVASFETELGTVVRMYEFDRYNETVWQVDVLLHQGSMWTHTKITNPTPIDLRGYWWTCVADKATPGTRIVSPAKTVAETDNASQMHEANWPHFHQAENTTGPGLSDDLSYMGNIINGDFFLRISEDQQPWIAHIDDDLYASIHKHDLAGTKFFTWGQNGPGRFMQDFLCGRSESEPRCGDYTELQTGNAPTQMQNWPLPRNSTKEWTEWLAMTKFDASVHSQDYDEALNTVQEFMNTSMSQNKFDDMDSWFKSISDREITHEEIVAEGMPWGALNELINGEPMTPGTRFEFIESDENRLWHELLSTGRFSNETLSIPAPLSYQMSEKWLEKIEESIQAGHGTWLHFLLLAVARAEMGDVNGPIDLLKQSMELKPNVVAARVRAVLASDVTEANVYFGKAWKIARDLEETVHKTRLLRALAKEMCFFYQSNGMWSDLREFMGSIPSEVSDLDAVLTSQIKLDILVEEYDSALEILKSNCFPTYASSRRDLQSDWYRAIEGRESKRVGRPLTPLEAHHARRDYPSPRNIGCAYGARYCTEYW